MVHFRHDQLKSMSVSVAVSSIKPQTGFCNKCNKQQEERKSLLKIEGKESWIWFLRNDKIKTMPLKKKKKVISITVHFFKYKRTVTVARKIIYNTCKPRLVWSVMTPWAENGWKISTTSRRVSSQHCSAQKLAEPPAAVCKHVQNHW